MKKILLPALAIVSIKASELPEDPTASSVTPSFIRTNEAIQNDHYLSSYLSRGDAATRTNCDGTSEQDQLVKALSKTVATAYSGVNALIESKKITLSENIIDIDFMTCMGSVFNYFEKINQNPCAMINSSNEMSQLANEMSTVFGEKYEELSDLSKVLFSIFKGVNAYVHNDFILTTSFLLEARQILTVKLKDKKSIDPLAYVILSDFGHKKKLSSIPKNSTFYNDPFYVLFLNHLRKIAYEVSFGTHIKEHIISHSLQFNERLKAFNPKLYGHAVYNTITLTYPQLLNLINIDNIQIYFNNIGFFLTPDQKRDEYREGIQRVTLAAICANNDLRFNEAYDLFLEIATKQIKIAQNSEFINMLNRILEKVKENPELYERTKNDFVTVVNRSKLRFDEANEKVV